MCGSWMMGSEWWKPFPHHRPSTTQYSLRARRNNGNTMPALTSEEQIRYGRHLVLPEVGPEGQAKLKAAKVLCVGAGGLGSPLLTYLAAAGVGTLGLVDDDTVDLSNLHRQPIHFTSDISRSKVGSAAEKLY